MSNLWSYGLGLHEGLEVAIDRALACDCGTKKCVLSRGRIIHMSNGAGTRRTGLPTAPAERSERFRHACTAKAAKGDGRRAYIPIVRCSAAGTPPHDSEV
jgi:hypothetical protein